MTARNDRVRYGVPVVLSGSWSQQKVRNRQFAVIERGGSRAAPAVIPTQDAERAQRVPAACASDSGFHLQGNAFAMKQV